MNPPRQIPVPPTLPTALHDPIAMHLSEQETQRANAIKAAVEADQEVKNLSDFEYVQFALVHPTPDPLDMIVQRCAALQSFKEENHIRDMPLEGILAAALMTIQHTDFVLNCHYVSQTGNCAMILDRAAYFPANSQTPEQQRNFLLAMYYYFQSINPTFYAIRRGITVLMECQGCGPANFVMGIPGNLFHAFSLAYPTNFSEIYPLNSPSVFNVAFGLMRRYLDPKMRDAFRMGYSIPTMEGVRLDQLYMTPTREIARRRMIEDLQKLLQLRYQHQSTYRLPPPPQQQQHPP